MNDCIVVCDSCFKYGTGTELSLHSSSLNLMIRRLADQLVSQLFDEDEPELSIGTPLCGDM